MKNLHKHFTRLTLKRLLLGYLLFGVFGIISYSTYEDYKNGTKLETAKEAIDSQGHSGYSLEITCSMVKDFSQRGKEFVEYIS